MQELIETAIYWSENEIGNIDKERFLAFIDGYKKIWSIKSKLENGIIEWLFR